MSVAGGRMSAMAGSASAKSPFGQVTLISGPEGLLADRAVAERLARARRTEPEVEVSDVEAVSLDAGKLAEITSPSLFCTARIAVVRDLAQLPADLSDQLVAFTRSPEPELGLVLVHAGGVKGKAVLDKLKKAGVEVVDCPTTKPWELPQFVRAEAKRLGSSIDVETAQFLVDAVGNDLRAVASAVSQLVADSTEGQISGALVKRYFGGRSEVTSFAVADAVLAGRTGQAMEQLRWALSTGVAPVLVTSALASGLRGLGKFVCAPGGLRDADLAREVGVPPWKLRTMRGQARGWDQAALARAIAVVAAADADVKGAADDAGFALERAVLAVAAARR